MNLFDRSSSLFTISFENKTDAIETVTPILDKDGIWRVSGYYIK